MRVHIKQISITALSLAFFLSHSRVIHFLWFLSFCVCFIYIFFYYCFTQPTRSNVNLWAWPEGISTAAHRLAREIWTTKENNINNIINFIIVINSRIDRRKAKAQNKWKSSGTDFMPLYRKLWESARKGRAKVENVKEIIHLKFVDNYLMHANWSIIYNIYYCSIFFITN